MCLISKRQVQYDTKHGLVTLWTEDGEFGNSSLYHGPGAGAPTDRGTISCILLITFDVYC